MEEGFVEHDDSASAAAPATAPLSTVRRDTDFAFIFGSVVP